MPPRPEASFAAPRVGVGFLALIGAIDPMMSVVRNSSWSSPWIRRWRRRIRRRRNSCHRRRRRRRRRGLRSFSSGGRQGGSGRRRRGGRRLVLGGVAARRRGGRCGDGRGGGRRRDARRCRRHRLAIRLRRPVTEPQHGGHGPEAHEQRRHAGKWKQDRAAADPTRGRTAAFLIGGRFGRFLSDDALSPRLRLGRRDGVGRLVHERGRGRATW